jgi:four helix bundle protein
MAIIRTFEEIEVWQKARILCQKIFAVTEHGRFARDFRLKDQINGSSGSIMDNIAEGFGRGGTREFLLFLSYARGSSDETRSQLYRALDRGYIDKETFEALKGDAMEVGKMITGFMSYLQKTDIKGAKFLEPDGPYPSNSQTSNP